jgi:phospholipase C
VNRVRPLVALLLALALAPAATAAAPIPRFRHVVVVVFENHERSDVQGQAPTFDALARRYASLTAYDAVSHPSLPNYLALVSGSTQGITSDCTDCVVHARSLANTLAAAGLTWKTYAEGLPSAGFLGASNGDYAKKHDPFAYFADVQGRPAWRKRIVPFAQLARDLAARRLPSFALLVPNLCNDMHSCPVATGDVWLRKHVVPLLASKQLAHSVVFVVFDEGSSSAGGGGNVEALALGPLVRRGAVDAQSTSHYGLLRTIEASWHLPLLGESAHAAPITGIWR